MILYLIYAYLAASAVSTILFCWLMRRAKRRADVYGYCNCSQGRFPCECGRGSSSK